MKYMKWGRRYLLQLSPEQKHRAEEIAGACRAVWNTGLEQRRDYRRHGLILGYAEQCRQLAEAKRDPYCAWLAEAPAHCLQQALRDLDRACRTHGAQKVRWRSKTRSKPSFRFPYAPHVRVRRVAGRWGEVRLPKLGDLRFRWTRPLGGTILNATVRREGADWFVSFIVEDGLPEAPHNGRPAVGVDRGVKVAIATSDGELRDRSFIAPGEAERLKRLQRRLSRSARGSARRAAVKTKLARLHARVRNRRNDFNAWSAHRLTRDHGLVVFEDLRIGNLTSSAGGTVEKPGRRVRQKAGLNRSILDKGWGDLLRRAEYKAAVNGSRIVRVPPAYTSQTCSRCGHVDPKSRESQADFRCTACGHREHADVNAGKIILAAGLAVSGRGDLAEGLSVKRQPPRKEAARWPTQRRESLAPVRERKSITPTTPQYRSRSTTVPPP